MPEAKADLIAALDVGKTHSRLAIVDAQSGQCRWSTWQVNQSRETALGRELDVGGIEDWLVRSLRDAPERGRIRHVVPIAHGAAAVLLDEKGKTLAAPDYEDPCFESVNEEYAKERDPFERTYSPSLPLGLNLGRQFFFLQQRHPGLFRRARQILTYPQYWAWRLSGVMASEVTSLGCHSDLWFPRSRCFSVLAQRRGWSTLFPPLRFAADSLGGALGPIGESADLAERCQIHCGIHDSNASYLRQLLVRRHRAFALVSSGTWTVVMANQASADALDAKADMLANVDAFGSLVATARFMGGREYETIARTLAPPTVAGLQGVIDRGALALPAFAAGGPFARHEGRLINAEQLSPAERAALATLYVALMVDHLLDRLIPATDIIIDGPLATNPLFAPLLANLRQEVRVFIHHEQRTTPVVRYQPGWVSMPISPPSWSSR